MRTSPAGFLVAATLGLVAPALAKAPPAAARKALTPVASVEGISEYDLPNGLRVLLFPDASKPTVTVNVTYFVGSRHEGYGETGMAHLLEHLMFKGTPTRDNILGLLQTRGAISNGSTSFDRTNYFEILPAIDGNLEFALALEADRMVHARVAKADLDKEFSVVRNEFEMGENDPQGVLEERMYSTAYLWHNYGKSTIGSRSDIERVPIEALRAFYTRFYQPDNAILIIAGKFDPQKALPLVEKEFGTLPRPTRTLSPSYTVEPVQDGERTVTLRRSGDVAVVGLLYHGVAGADPDQVAEEALVHLLTDKPSGRLHKALVESGLASEVSGDAAPLAEPGAIEFQAKATSAKTVDQVRQKMLEVVEGLAATKITDEEVKRFQSQTLRQLELRLTQADRIGIELSEWAAIGDWRMIFLHRDAVKKVTAAQVQSVAARFLKPSNRTLGLFVPTQSPDRSPLPPTVDVAALVRDYKGEASMATGEEFVATVENVENRTQRSVLADGMKVALLPKSTRGAAVVATLNLHYGTEADLRGKTTAAELLPEMLLRGTTSHTYQQLRDELDRLTAEVAIAGRPGQATVGIRTVRKNLPAVLALVAEALQHPSLPRDQFEVLRKERLAALEEATQNPQEQAMVAVQRKLEPHVPLDVRYVPTTREEIERVKAVKLEELADLHKTLWGASAAELAVVGDFDSAEIAPVVAKLLGAWKSPRPFVRIPNPLPTGVMASDEIIATPDKQMAMVVAAHGIALRDEDPEYPALKLVNFVFGGAFKSRLVDRLRQKEGISYGAFSNLGSDPFEKHGTFSASAICAPQNAQKAMAALVEELQRLVKDGIPAVELAEAKKSFTLSFDNQMAQDRFVAGRLAQGLYVGRTLDFDRKVNERIASLKSEELGPIVQKYIEVGRLVKIKAGDLKN